jgi:pimeloyl-ACP methyl ester carboxylesterase
MWLDVAEDIARDGHDVALPDIRGLGEAPDWDESEPLSLSTIAHDVIRMLDALEIEKAVIGGCSLGGYVSLEMLRLFPKRVEALILVDTKASADTDLQRANRLDLIEQRKTSNLLHVLLDGIEHQMLHESSLDNAAVMKLFQDMLQNISIDGVCKLLEAMSKRDDYFSVLKSSSVPVLSIRGESDAVSTNDDHQAIVQSSKNAVHVEIEAAGHLAPLEKPLQVSKVIREFLTTLSTMSEQQA